MKEEQLTFWSEEHPVSPSALPDFAKVLKTLGGISCSHLGLLQTILRFPGLSGKTSPESCHQTEDGILLPSSGCWGNSGMGSPTGFLTLNTLEFPSGAVASSLSDILATGDVPRRYFLSPIACRGILRRAEKRGKTLPEALRLALTRSATQLKTDSARYFEAAKEEPVRLSRKGWRASNTTKVTPKTPESQALTKSEKPSPPNTEPGGGNTPLVAHTLRGNGFDASEDGTGRGIPLVVGTLMANGKAAGSATQQDAEAGMLIPSVSFTLTSHHGRQDSESETLLPVPFRQISDTLTAAMGTKWNGNGAANNGSQYVHYPKELPVGFNARQDLDSWQDRTGPLDTDGGTQAVAFSTKDHGADAGELSPTLRAMNHSGSHQNGGGQVGIAQTSGVRRLLPVECERLQSFEDGWTNITYRGKPASDGPRYKAIGNSMAVVCMEWLGQRIELVEAMDWN